jgi:uncharacterized protein YdeI (YjbR/CyaY-like superfamily)
MQKKETATFCPASKAEWRQWLEENHLSKPSIWLVYYKKKSGVPSLTWSEAVDEALCFGWIDSTMRPHGEDTFMQFFSKRKTNSVWSKVNKAKIQRLIEEGLMMEKGFEAIEAAKANGSWTILDEAEELVIPLDLENAFETKPGSKDFFLSLSKSVRKAILQWLVLAKQQETRQRRINEIAELAGQGLKPKQF